MKLLKALVISFSMYSGIPMPQFDHSWHGCAPFCRSLSGKRKT